MRILSHMRHSEFLRHNAIFFIGSVAVGALNYLYYPIVGRLLEPASFGEVQTLISLFLQLSTFLTVLSLVAVSIVANSTDTRARNMLIFEFEKLALLGSIFLVLLTLVFRTQLQHFWQFESSWPFVLLALSVVVTVPFILRGAFLRGQKKFGLASGANIVSAGGKLIFSTLLVLAGLSTVGAIAGLVAAQVVACLFVVWYAYRLGLHLNASRAAHTLAAKLRDLRGRLMAMAKLPKMKLLMPELRYAAIVLAASLAITLQYSIDIIVVKHYFDAHTAGLYAGIASVARIVFFLTASIAQVLMPAVKLGQPAAENRRLLQKSVLLLIAFGLPTVLVLALAPHFTVGLLMGGQYDEIATVLPRLTIAIFIVSILNVFVAYYLTLRRYGIALVASLGFCITTLFILMHHSSLAAVVDSLLVGSIAMSGILAVWIVTNTFKERKAI